MSESVSLVGMSLKDQAVYWKRRAYVLDVELDNVRAHRTLLINEVRSLTTDLDYANSRAMEYRADFYDMRGKDWPADPKEP